MGADGAAYRPQFDGPVQGVIIGENNTVTIVYENGDRRDVPFLAPLRPSAGLIGRNDLLDQLKQKLFGAGTFAFQGLPGVGKTALAAELVNNQEVLKHFQDGVLWASLGPNASISLHLAEWAKALGIPLDQINMLASLDDRQKAIHTAIGLRRMLLVVDDAWQPEAALAFQLGGPNCTHIVTTRRPEVALHFSYKVIKINELDQDSGLALLSKLAPEVVEAEKTEALTLVQVVGSLPLALILMGKYLHFQGRNRQPQRLRAALNRLHQAEERLVLTQPRAPLDGLPGLSSDVPVSLLAVIGISYEALNEPLQHVLRSLSVFSPKPNTFPQEAALTVAAAPVEALYELDDHGLLEVVPPDRYTLHQTIADYARAKLTDTAATERMVEFFVTYVITYHDDYDALAMETVANGNVLTALKAADQRSMYTALVEGTIALSRFLIEKGLYQIAEDHLTRAKEAAESLTKQNDTKGALTGVFHLATTIVNLNELTLLRGNYRIGEQTLRAAALIRNFKERVVETGERAEQGNHLLASIHTLLSRAGASAAGSGDYTQARAFYEEALIIAREIEDLKKEIDSLRGLGMIAEARLDYDQAEEFYQEAFTLAQETEDYQALKDSLTALRKFENNRGEHKQADKYVQQQIDLIKQQFERAPTSSEHHVSTLLQTERLLLDAALLLYDLGDYDGSKEVIQAAIGSAREAVIAAQTEDVKNWKAIFRDTQIGVVSLLHSLSLLESERGEYQQAEEFAEEALSLAHQMDYRDLIGQQHLWLGQLKLESGAYQAAGEYLSNALELAEEMRHSRLTAEIYLQLGDLDLKQQQLNGAFEAFTTSLSVAREINNLDLIAFAHYGLAQVSFAQEKVEDARHLAQESISVLDTIHHPTAESVKQWLASLSVTQPSQKFGAQLSASLPEGWRTEETIKLFAPHGEANVLVSRELLDPGITTQQYSRKQTNVLRKDFPGYRELALVEAQFLAGRPAYIRRFEWKPPDGEPVMQIQLYYADKGQGIVATATTTSTNFERFELQLRQVLSGIMLEM